MVVRQFPASENATVKMHRGWAWQPRWLRDATIAACSSRRSWCWRKTGTWWLPDWPDRLLPTPVSSKATRERPDAAAAGPANDRRQNSLAVYRPAPVTERQIGKVCRPDSPDCPSSRTAHPPAVANQCGSGRGSGALPRTVGEYGTYRSGLSRDTPSVW